MAPGPSRALGERRFAIKPCDSEKPQGRVGIGNAAPNAPYDVSASNPSTQAAKGGVKSALFTAQYSRAPGEDIVA